ncbi:MAG: isoprenylcysteine carboxylmethyltransferase family protein [Anaerolineales bacterium]
MNKNAIHFLMFIVPALAIVLALLGVETLFKNILGWVLLLTGVVYAAGVVIVGYIRRETFWETHAQGDTVQAEQGDRSFWMIALAMMAVFYLSPLEYIYLPTRLLRHDWMEIGGLALFVCGGALFVWARRTLGKSYSGHLSVQTGQQLVQNGPYQLVRHPAYTGYLLMALGIAVGYSSLTGIGSTVFILLPCMIYRIHVEDALLAKHFGEQFELYRHRVKRLIPGIW